MVLYLAFDAETSLMFVLIKQQISYSQGGVATLTGFGGNLTGLPGNFAPV
jgi:hypothetical protein